MCNKKQLKQALVVKSEECVQAHAKIKEQGGIIKRLHEVIESKKERKDKPYGDPTSK